MADEQEVEARPRLRVREWPGAVRDRWLSWSRRRRILVVVAALLVMAFVIDAGVIYTSIDRVDLRLQGSGAAGETWLLVGNDSRAFVDTDAESEQYGSTRNVPNASADILLVLHRPAGGGPPSLVSLPRDLVVDTPGMGFHRLGLSLGAGPQLLVDTVCGSLGLSIDHVAMVDMRELESLIDAVGGVDIDVALPTRDAHTGIDLPAGTNHLDGKRAVAWIRSRHVEVEEGGVWHPAADGYEARQEHAQQVMAQLAGRISDQMWNPLTARSVAHSAASSVSLDSGVGVMDLSRFTDALAQSVSTADELPVSAFEAELTAAELTPESVEVLRKLGSGDDPDCPAPLPAGQFDPNAPVAPAPGEPGLLDGVGPAEQPGVGVGGG